ENAPLVTPTLNGSLRSSGLSQRRCVSFGEFTNRYAYPTLTARPRNTPNPKPPTKPKSGVMVLPAKIRNRSLKVGEFVVPSYGNGWIFTTAAVSRLGSGSSAIVPESIFARTFEKCGLPAITADIRPSEYLVGGTFVSFMSPVVTFCPRIPDNA